GAVTTAAPAPAPAAAKAPRAPEPKRAPAPSSSFEETIRQRSSPLVRKIAKEHEVDISQLHGTGIAGRVTKNDILEFLSGKPASAGQAGQVGRAGQAGEVTEARRPAAGGDRTEKMSPMRKRIAEHMVLSRKTSAHVHSVFEVNFSRVAQVREAKKAEF